MFALTLFLLILHTNRKRSFSTRQENITGMNPICSKDAKMRSSEDVSMKEILDKCHSSPYGGHFAGQRTAAKVLQSGFYWPTLFEDAHAFVQSCDRCQRTGNISWRNEMKQEMLLEVELFNVWGIDFMGPFVNSFGKEYILLAVDYVSK